MATDDNAQSAPELPVRVNRQEAPEVLRSVGLPMSAHTLAKLACVGGGPPFQVWNGRATYSTDALLAWAKGRLGPPITNTAQRQR